MLNVPNLLSLLRLFLVPLFLWASVKQLYTLAFSIFVFAAVTDILDGWIARRFNMRSRLGAFLDPAADKTLMVFGYLFYTTSDALPLVRVPLWLTFVVFARDVLIVIFAYLLYTRVQVKRFPPSVAGKTSTVLQAVALAAAIGTNAFLPFLAPVMRMLFQVVLVVTLFSAWDYLRRADGMLRGEWPEPPRRRDRSDTPVAS